MGKKGRHPRLRVFRPTEKQLSALTAGRKKSALYIAGKKRHDKNLLRKKGP